MAEKHDAATINYVERTMGKYGLTSELESKSIPVMGDAVLRQATREMSSIYGICASHNFSNAAKSAVRRKGPEFFPELDQKYKQVEEILKTANTPIKNIDKRNGEVATLNIFLKEYILSGESKINLLRCTGRIEQRA